MKRAAAEWVKENLPNWLLVPLTRIKYRNLTAWNREALAQLKLPLTVASGPFRGMKYLSESCGSALIPKLLGTYEKELHPVISNLLARTPQLVIDIGAAEGYYAIGIALQCPQARVATFDTFGFARYLQREMTQLNSVTDRLDIHGRCDMPELESALKGRDSALVICDCEGYEQTLLDPSAVPPLKQATILVETHDMLVPGVTEKLIERFKPTHTITRIDAEPRVAGDFPLVSDLEDSRKVQFMNEYRPPGMKWLYMTPTES